MDLTFRGTGPWGPGKGANLQPAEVDDNFWEIATAVLNLENNPALPVGIQSITISGTQMTITLSDGTVMGPYTIPVLVMRWRDEWQPNTPYVQLDVFKVTDRGIYMAQLDHVSGDFFDPDIAVDGAPALFQIFGSADAQLSQLPDVVIQELADGDALIWDASTSKWVNRFLEDMAYQPSSLVNITGGYIGGLAGPVNPNDAATKAYVDGAVSGVPSMPAATMLSNILVGAAPPAPNTLSDFLDAALGSTVVGNLIVRLGAGWQVLPPGSTGNILQSNGPGVPLAWVTSPGAGVVSVSAGAGITTGGAPITSSGSVALAPLGDNNFLGNISGATTAPVGVTISQFLDHALGTARGTLLTRTIAGWVALAPGTSGYYLKTQGAGADAVWDAPAGSGTVTSVGSGAGLTGGPITSTGSLSLATIADASVLANTSGGVAAPVPTSVSALLDKALGTTQGAVLHRGNTAWVALAPGTSGQVLTTGGAAANPSWQNAPSSGSAIANLRLLANISGATAVATANTLSAILDAIISSARGTLLFRTSTGWTGLAPGTSGQVLQTGGAAGDPSWVAPSGGGGGSGITELTGDVAAGPGSGSQAATLATTAVTPGSYTLADITVDAKGRLTAAASGTAPAAINQLTGDATAGPGGGSQALTLSTSGVVAGTYSLANITVDAKGRVTGAASGTAITQLTGDATTGAGGGLQALTLSTSGVSAGSYTAANITVDAKGRVTAAANGGGGSGTVTSVAAGTGLSASPSPIVGAGTLSLTVPVTVGNGGTGSTSLAQYNVLMGNGAAAVFGQPPGTSGGILSSNGPAAMPSYRSLNVLLDILVGTGVQGQILYRGSAVWGALAPGTAGQFLQTGGTAANVSWASAAPLASPVFTGDPKAPTPATSDNDTSIATTAYVQAQGYVTGGPYLPTTATGLLTITTDGTVRTTFGAGGTQAVGMDVTVGRGLAAGGIQCRPGTAGTPVGNQFNINWTGTPQLWIDTVNTGTLTVTCDYRIKENVAELPSTWDKVKALRPISYTRKENAELLMTETDAAERWGFLAHELQDTLLPTAATGVKDEPNLIQSPDIMALLASVTKALQEAMVRIEQLEATIKGTR